MKWFIFSALCLVAFAGATCICSPHFSDSNWDAQRHYSSHWTTRKSRRFLISQSSGLRAWEKKSIFNGWEMQMKWWKDKRRKGVERFQISSSTCHAQSSKSLGVLLNRQWKKKAQLRLIALRYPATENQRSMKFIFKHSLRRHNGGQMVENWGCEGSHIDW